MGELSNAEIADLCKVSDPETKVKFKIFLYNIGTPYTFYKFMQFTGFFHATDDVPY